MPQTRLEISLTAYLKDNPEGKEVLADKFEVATSTVERWADGTVVPYSNIKRSILKRIGNAYLKEIPERLPISGARGTEKLIRLQERVDYLNKKVEERGLTHGAIVAEVSALNWAIHAIVTYENMLV